MAENNKGCGCGNSSERAYIKKKQIEEQLKKREEKINKSNKKKFL